MREREREGGEKEIERDGEKRDGEEDYLVPKARKLTIVNQTTIKCHFRRTKENEILFSLHNYSPFF